MIQWQVVSKSIPRKTNPLSSEKAILKLVASHKKQAEHEGIGGEAVTMPTSFRRVCCPADAPAMQRTPGVGVYALHMQGYVANAAHSG